MSLHTLNPVAYGIAPVNGAHGSHSKVSKVTMMNRQALPPLQVKEKEKPVLAATSRREMMHLTAASLGLLTLLSSAPAEARPRNATMRQKIMEKFEELRLKAGLSKPKDEGEEKKPKAGLENKLKLKDGAEGTKPATTHQHSNEELSVPALPSIINGKTVETTLL